MAGRFGLVKLGPPIEVFALNRAYLEDENPNKVNLGVGAYRTDENKPWVLPVVKKVEKALAEDPSQNHEYLPILGLDAFTKAATSMLLGENSQALAEGRAFGVQTLSGTGALRIGAEFLSKILKYNTFYYSKPTWENHHLVFVNSGFTDPHTYTYWDPKTKSIDFEAMCKDISSAPENSVIILHACAHNPTGCDPTREQWMLLAEIMREKKLFPFFDSAYQGFASGDLDEDAWAVRYFAEQGFEMLVSQSFAKNFGLYNERVGNLTFVVADKCVIPSIKSQVTIIIRGMYSNPPNHGCRIVATVLNNPELYKEWKQCIRIMSNRIKEMRKGLKERLRDLKTPNDNKWNHITEQIGMFSYTGLNPGHVELLRQNHHVYMLKSGRINMCGLTSKNLNYVAAAIHDAVTSDNSI
ncbi:aspartate aminotransferase, cytoplasmic, putative [Pediculus humanus corporis]|uniref:Aspartate aminotransferase n=1 Tax=Pediculus humanus subsp. corporis TaxID=121224 RepID=E0VIU2_PEDHC|nr:aspartate aminotransferase, cytoplasmic, putative [Pediculus humanus corporis]EEB13298.1 aspartate aminotransferase, cytoplasmic, putative [Pediculus humanus corporis]